MSFVIINFDMEISSLILLLKNVTWTSDVWTVTIIVKVPRAYHCAHLPFACVLNQEGLG